MASDERLQTAEALLREETRLTFCEASPGDNCDVTAVFCEENGAPTCWWCRVRAFLASTPSPPTGHAFDCGCARCNLPVAPSPATPRCEAHWHRDSSTGREYGHCKFDRGHAGNHITPEGTEWEHGGLTATPTTCGTCHDRRQVFVTEAADPKVFEGGTVTYARPCPTCRPPGGST